MPRRISIVMSDDRPTLKQLEHLYRNEKEPVKRSHYQIIWLLASGRTTEEVGKVTGYGRSWIYELVWGYNRVGVETLGDRRADHPGAVPILNAQQTQEFIAFLNEKGVDNVSGADCARWMSEVVGFKVSRQRGHSYRKRAIAGDFDEVKEHPKRLGVVQSNRVRRVSANVSGA